MTTFTFAPFLTSSRTSVADLYAAILPQMPKTMFLPCMPRALKRVIKLKIKQKNSLIGVFYTLP
ncbi:hypothetical protein MuYL_4103 [Mucilaginibacter xinganensis]|uniref:Uncharacterized protein n=1 Tax=Mucilaginibacter xinganensis TaxID=1234841 RepID=A0A223P2D3_9SPHI|nr:hypothetical protein MuYL_4103 [Mucilaginibacter xinganensis]